MDALPHNLVKKVTFAGISVHLERVIFAVIQCILRALGVDLN